MNLKSSNLYEHLALQTNMAILSKRLILQAILLYKKFMPYTQISLRTTTQGRFVDALEDGHAKRTTN